MSTPRFRPVVEELDARTVPSAALDVAPGTAPPALSAPPSSSHPLHGTGGGGYTQAAGPVDAGIARALHGTVALHGLGTFDLSGWVQRTGMIQRGRATGHVVLTNAHGSLTLALHGPAQAGFGPIPAELVYSITGGTGAYAGVTGYGVVQAAFVPAPAVPAPDHPSHGGPMPPVHPPATGQFKITLY